MPKVGNALNAEPGKPDCENCPLSQHTGRGYKQEYYVEASIVPYAPIAAIGMAPGREEVVANHVFVGPAGRILDMGFDTVGLEREREVSCLNLLGCKVPDTKAKANDWSLAGVKAIKACAPRFVRDLKKAAPELLVTLGSIPLQAVDPTAKGKLSKIRGYFRELTDEQGGGLERALKLMPTFHPAYFLYPDNASRGLISQFKRDLSKAKEVCKYGVQKAVRRTNRRIVSVRRDDSSVAGTGSVRQEGVDWSVGSIRGTLSSAVLDVETSVVEKDHQGSRLRCIGVAAYPRTSSKRRGSDEERPRVRVVPMDRFPRRLAKLRRLCGHNTPYDYATLRRRGHLRESDPITLDDTMVMASLFDENREQGLKTFAEENDFERYWEKVDQYWKKTKAKPATDPPDDELFPYNACDVALTHKLYSKFRQQLDEEEDLGFYYDHFLTKAIRLSAELTLNGVKTETTLADEVPRMKRRLRYRHQKFFDIAGVPKAERDPKKLGTTDWLRDFLFGPGGLSLPVEKRFRTAKTKKPQLSRDHFEHLRDIDESGCLQILYELSFIQKQYEDLEKMLPDAGGLVYPNYNIGGTGARDDENKPVRTGRWSARDPNVQQFAPYLKRHVGSRYADGWIMQWDGDQMEVRVAACYSGDRRLVAIFESGDDPYIDCATALFGRDRAAARRFMGKRALLGAIYGVGAGKLKSSLNRDLADRGFREKVTINECKAFLEQLESHYADHYEWIHDTKATVRRTGVVESLTGRRRHLPHGRHADRHAYNQAVNFPIQNLANDLNLLAAIQFGWRFAGGVLCTLVHDSGVADCRDLDAVGRAERRVRRVWRDLPTLEYFGFEPTVPLSISVSAGRKWSPMKEFTDVSELEEVA